MLSQKLWNVIVERWKKCVITSRNPKVQWHKLDSFIMQLRENDLGNWPRVLFVLGLCDCFCFRLCVVLLRYLEDTSLRLYKCSALTCSWEKDILHGEQYSDHVSPESPALDRNVPTFVNPINFQDLFPCL